MPEIFQRKQRDYLQQQVFNKRAAERSCCVEKNYTVSNRVGRTTTYVYKTANDKKDVQDFINEAL